MAHMKIFTGSMMCARPLIGSSVERVYSRLEPGNYFVKKDFEVQGYGHYYKIACFTVR